MCTVSKFKKIHWQLNTTLPKWQNYIFLLPLYADSNLTSKTESSVWGSSVTHSLFEVCSSLLELTSRMIREENCEEAALKLTQMMEVITQWIADSCLHLNVKKPNNLTLLTEQASDIHCSEQNSVYTWSEKRQVVSSLKCLSVILDSASKNKLSKLFQKHFSTNTFRFLWKYLTPQAAKIYFHAVISHMSLTADTITKPV